jgi:GPI mannosyltransferase 3
VASTVAAQPPLMRSTALWAIATLCLGAFLLRLIPVLFYPSLHFPDEVFQTAEQAHRLVYGNGIRPWEFDYGARSWLLPGAIAGLMEIARLAGDGPDFYLPLIAVSLAALALAPVVCCFLWCRRFFGIAGALVGGLAVAVTPDLVYLGARTLTEVVAAHVLVIALYLLDTAAAPAFRRLAVAGALLGLAFALRFHLGPAIGLAVLWSVARAPRQRLAPIALGAAVALVPVALLDTLTLGYPFASIVRNTVYNVFYGVSDFFGTSPWYFYGGVMFWLWRGGIFVFLAFAALGFRRLPMLAAVAAAIVATHLPIGHKEYRFIYPALVLLAILAGTGLARAAAWIEERLRRWRGWDRGTHRVGLAAIAVALAGGWSALCAEVAALPPFARVWGLSHNYLSAAALVADSPQTCGIALYGLNWIDAGGYTHFHRAVPMYWPGTPADLRAAVPGFNELVFMYPPPRDLGFVVRQCFGVLPPGRRRGQLPTCVAERPGPCEPMPMAPMSPPAPLLGVAPPP